jgi:hypothetical protein
MSISQENAARAFIRGALITYLDGKESLSWLIKILESTGIRGSKLNTIFEDHKEHGDPERFQEAHSACKEQGWFD